MIEYVHRRLAAWGEWSMSREDGGFSGGGSQFRYREPVPGAAPTGEALSKILANSPALEMEMGVAWLRKHHPDLGQLVINRYRDAPHLTEVEQAKLDEISDRTLRNRRDRAHWLLLDWLNGRAIGEFEDDAREAWNDYVAKAPKIGAKAA